MFIKNGTPRTGYGLIINCRTCGRIGVVLCAVIENRFNIRASLCEAADNEPGNAGIEILGNCPTWRTNYFQCIYLFIDLYMFRACHAHHQEKQIVSIQLLVIVVRRTGMLLITLFVELRVVAGRSRKLAGRPQAVSGRPCCAVALRRTVWSEHGMGTAWAWHEKCESDTE